MRASPAAMHVMRLPCLLSTSRPLRRQKLPTTSEAEMRKGAKKEARAKETSPKKIHQRRNESLVSDYFPEMENGI